MLLDLDALARAEGENWVWQGRQLLRPGYGRALVELSRGGADAAVVREFDLTAAGVRRRRLRAARGQEHRRLDRRRHRLRRHRLRARLDDRRPATRARSERWRRGHAAGGRRAGVRGRADGRARRRRATTRRPASSATWSCGRWTSTGASTSCAAARSCSASTCRRTPTSTCTASGCWSEPQRRGTVGGATYPAGSPARRRRSTRSWPGERDLEVLFEPDARTSLQDYAWTRHHLILTRARGRARPGWRC